jgi:hypothetical protein
MWQKICSGSWHTAKNSNEDVLLLGAGVRVQTKIFSGVTIYPKTF